MKKKILFLIPILAVLLSVNNVHAYVNGELYENLIFPNRGTFISFNGNTGTDLGTSMQLDSTDVHTDYQRQYYYLTNPNLYNDSSGTAFRFTTPVTIVENEIIDLSIVLCSDIQDAWYGNGVPTVMVGYNAQTLNGSLYHAPTTSGWDVLTYNYETDATDFKRCNIYKMSFTSQGIGQYISVRFKSSSAIRMGTLSFMGYQFSKNGIDYTGYFNSLGNSIDSVTNQQEITNDKLDDVINGDVPDSDIDKPNTGGFDDYEDSENDLKDKVNQADLSNLSIGIDSSSSNWVWDTLTDLIRSNSIIFGMFISILSIGIIKLALGR